MYTQRFNRKHKRVGHLFQGRYKAILVDKDAYLLELSRYIVLNPVRAKGLVDSPEEWLWSSYLATMGKQPCPEWLAAAPLLRCFAGKRKLAVECYREFVRQGKGVKVWDQVKSQVFLGSDACVKRHQQLLQEDELPEVPLKQKRAEASSLVAYVSDNQKNPKQGMVNAYLSGSYSMKEIAKAFHVHYSTVSRAVAQSKT